MYVNVVVGGMLQCCQMSCCLAADVIDLMMQRHEKCLRLASEIVLLQTVVNPARLCCAEVCWLVHLLSLNFHVIKCYKNYASWLTRVTFQDRILAWLEKLQHVQC